MPAAIADEHRDAVLRRLDGGTSERRPLDAWAGDGVGPATLVEPVDEPVGLLMLEESPSDASYGKAPTPWGPPGRKCLSRS